MVQGSLLPRALSILPSVVSITFIGRGPLSKRFLKPIFRVRRFFVAEALQWLRKHNVKYYGAIEIDPDLMQVLPVDDVPAELLGVVRQTTDTSLISQEGAGYVPSQQNGQSPPLLPLSFVILAQDDDPAGLDGTLLHLFA